MSASRRSVPAALLDLAVATFCFCALGLAVAAVVPRGDAAFPIAWGTILPLCFISDVFIPIDNAPPWLQHVASLFPLRPFADDLQRAFDPLRRGPLVEPGHLELIAVWGAAAAVFALLRFRWEPASRGPRRRGGTQRPAVFAVERLRALFEERGERLRGPGSPAPPSRPAAPAGRPGTPASPPGVSVESEPGALGEGPPAGERSGAPVPGSSVEWIEGPAPSEDSSVPPSPGR